MNPKPDNPARRTFTIVIRDAGEHGAEPIPRLRRLLKAARRSYGYSVLSIEETTEPQPTEGPDHAAESL